MRANQWGFALILMLVAIALVILDWQRRTAIKLREEIGHRRAAAADQSRLDAEAQQLAAKQLSPDELERLHAERSAVTSLRAEIETMRRRLQASTRVAVDRDAVAMELTAKEPSMESDLVAANFWKNAGEATPVSAFQTALWAGAGGDVEKLASLLAFDDEARIKAEAIFANLPPNLQQELATPQQLIALLVAKDIPLGSARILTRSGTPTEAKISAKLLDAEGKSKTVNLSLRTDANKWRFVVSGKTIERYAARLQAPVVEP